MLPVFLLNLNLDILDMEDMESPTLAHLWVLQDMALLLFLDFMEDMLELADILPTLLELFTSQSAKLTLRQDILDMEDMESPTLAPL